MSDSVQMPALGESVSEGTITRWLKRVGERVDVDEPLLEVSTDKVDTEIPSPVAGVLEQILVDEDETVAVGEVLAVIGQGRGAGPVPAVRAAVPDPAPVPAIQAAAPQTPPTGVPRPAPAPVPASPAAGRVQMPALGESVSEGTITRWLKRVGERVDVDEPLLEVSTDKVDTEIPSPVAGVLEQILVDEDETVAVGVDLAVVSSDTPVAGVPEPAPAPATPAPEPAEPQPAPEPAPPKLDGAGHVPVSRPLSPADLSVYVTPLVRRLAAENRVDLSTVPGTGVGGRIRKQDVLDAAEALRAAEAAKRARQSDGHAPSGDAVPTASAALRGTTVPLSRLRKIIAKRMVESLQTSAQLTTVVEVDMTRIATLRARAATDFTAREGVKLTFLPFFALAAVEALKQFPVINASIDGDAIVYHPTENLAVAVDTERGLLVPVIRNAGDLSIAGLARKIADVAERTRRNKISPDELTGGTFTLTNTGSRGALFDTPIINQPQAAILGTGVITKRAVVVRDTDGGDTIAIRSMVYLSLTYDHQIVDGADAARFLSAIKQRLEEGRFEPALGL
jgi:pyruvate dehydrogenase E2 component (dihydrolipoamide acetyltransferase)